MVFNKNIEYCNLGQENKFTDILEMSMCHVSTTCENVYIEGFFLQIST